MATTNITKSFVIIFSTVFFGSFYILRSVFDGVEWHFLVELLLNTLSSGIAAALLVPYLKDKEKLKIGILLSSLYFFSLVGTLIYLNGRSESFSDIQLTGVWMTKESDGNNFALDFYEKNNVRLISPTNDERFFSYSWKKNRLQLYDKDGNLVFNWVTELDFNQLILHQESDQLIFYRQ